MNRKMPKDIDEYLERHSKEDQRLLRQMRATIRKAAPEATEKISYGIPTLYLNGNLVHFAAFPNHIGFYPTSSGIAASGLFSASGFFSASAAGLGASDPHPASTRTSTTAAKRERNIQVLSQIDVRRVRV